MTKTATRLRFRFLTLGTSDHKHIRFKHGNDAVAPLATDRQRGTRFVGTVYIVRYIPTRLNYDSCGTCDVGVRVMGPKFKRDCYDVALLLAAALCILVAISTVLA